MNFANNIKVVRKEAGLSQEQLAEKLGVSRQSVSKWESNQSYPEMDKILLICKLFDCDISELMSDNIKEASEAKQSKTKINKAIEDFFDYITRFVDMFMAMTIRQKIKCVLEQIINAGVLILICLILWGILGSIIGGLLGSLSFSAYHIIYSVIKSVFLGVSFIASITVLLHIFKIRYLDYYEIIKPEKADAPTLSYAEQNIQETEGENEEVKENSKHKPWLFGKREKIIIRDAKHSNSSFLVAVIKTLVVFFKVLMGLTGISFAFCFVFILAGLVASLLFAKSGLLFIGAFLLLASLLAVNFLILRAIYNFLTSRKSSKRITALILIIALAVSGLGTGLFFIGTTQFNVVDTAIVGQTDFTVSMSDNLAIASGHSAVRYIETALDEIKITVTHSKYTTAYLEQDSDYVYIYANQEQNFFELIRAIIKDINKKQINSSYFDNPIEDITVYASSENIQKLKQNDEFYISAEQRISDLEEENYKLENENSQLKDELIEKDAIIESMNE